jgi:ParB family transcriptional regulator, chromosome partitioning protein
MSTMTTMTIAKIKVSRQRHGRDMGDLAGLAENIKLVGLLHPVVVTPDGVLLCGERRLEACKRLGWTNVEVRIAKEPPK